MAASADHWTVFPLCIFQPEGAANHNHVIQYALALVRDNIFLGHELTFRNWMQLLVFCFALAFCSMWKISKLLW